ncbi:hypothetical protein N657DRAFT_481361 [Parathielavia appendiculata]|uniref:Uncharacterized protein n=1 Tax=Parathielavia appendiculata TaxID=2587402 RepID=A0AAN6Z3L4_9PEZI|nr:hypothetical protein N657DRAFT_481361 [Parathielavia appendiculata]
MVDGTSKEAFEDAALFRFCMPPASTKFCYLVVVECENSSMGGRLGSFRRDDSQPGFGPSEWSTDLTHRKLGTSGSCISNFDLRIGGAFPLEHSGLCRLLRLGRLGGRQPHRACSVGCQHRSLPGHVDSVWPVPSHPFPSTPWILRRNPSAILRKFFL